MSKGRYIAWVVDAGRSPEWLLREYHNKVKRVIQMRRVLERPNFKDMNTGRPPSPAAINIYRRSLPIRERDLVECREAIRWLARRGLLRKIDRNVCEVSK
jgi:hypothetical protein